MLMQCNFVVNVQVQLQVDKNNNLTNLTPSVLCKCLLPSVLFTFSIVILMMLSSFPRPKRTLSSIIKLQLNFDLVCDQSIITVYDHSPVTPTMDRSVPWSRTITYLNCTVTFDLFRCKDSVRKQTAKLFTDWLRGENRIVLGACWGGEDEGGMAGEFEEKLGICFSL